MLRVAAGQMLRGWRWRGGRRRFPDRVMVAQYCFMPCVPPHGASPGVLSRTSRYFTLIRLVFHLDVWIRCVW